MTSRLRQTGELNAQKQNIEAERRNQLTQVNAGIAAGNTAMLNDFNQRTTDFKNQRQAALFQNNKALFERLQGVVRDLRLEQHDIDTFELLSKQYDPGVLRRTMGDTAWENLIIGLETSDDPRSKVILEQFKKATEKESQ